MTGDPLLHLASLVVPGIAGGAITAGALLWWRQRPPRAEAASTPHPPPRPSPAAVPVESPTFAPPPRAAAPPPQEPAPSPSGGAHLNDVERSKARGRELLREGRLEEGFFYFRQAQRLAAEEIEQVIGQCFPHGAPVGTGPALQRLLTRLDDLPSNQRLLATDDPLFDDSAPEDGVRGNVALRLRTLAGDATAERAQPADLTTLLRAVADYSLTVATQEEIHEALLEQELEEAGRRLETYLHGAGLDGEARR